MEADLLIGPTGQPQLVLQCSGAAECPPACDQVCRTLAEAVTGPAVALLVLPHASGPAEEID